MKMKTTSLFLCVCALGICGCRSFKYGGAPEPSFSLKDDLRALEKKFGASTKIDEFTNNPTKETRNNLIAHRLVLMDMRYIEFITTMTSDKQLIDSATDMLLLGLNLAGVATGGTEAKTALAAVAAGVGGSKAIVDKNFYLEKTIPALIASMNAERKAALVPILTGMRQSLDDYPLGQAIIDLQNYYFAGTLLGAIQAIQIEAGAKESKNQEVIRTLRPVTQADVDRTAALTTAIRKLTEADFDKLKQAIKLLDPSAAEPANLEAAKAKMRTLIREKPLEVVEEKFKEAGITY